MTSAVLVDTDVMSFIIRDQAHASLYRKHLDGRILAISFMTQAELLRWSVQNAWGDRRQAELLEHLSYSAVYRVDDELCDTWAWTMASAAWSGNPIQCADAWIASTALRYDLPLVTHNRRHFAHVQGLNVISEAPL
jgi:tRNA(fMet)-specific endonuclease VapC